MNAQPAATRNAILGSVERYYTGRLHAFGATARGVDWNSEASQELRFDQLLAVVDGDGAGESLLDLGCGYGALLDTLRRRGLPLEYRGCDISAAMVEAARLRYAGDARAVFATGTAALVPATYAVASGIFNVKLDHAPDAWRAYVDETLGELHEAGTRGFAFNMLSTYSDPERRRDTLYYADPREVFDDCKRRFSPRVALLHDYPLYEFTVVVRK